MQLSQILGQFEEILEQDGNDLLQAVLNVILHYLALLPHALPTTLVGFFRLGEQVVKTANNQVDRLDLEIVLSILNLMDLVPEEGA